MGRGAKFPGLLVLNCLVCGWRGEAREPRAIQRLRLSHSLNCEGARFEVKSYQFTVPPPKLSTGKRSKLIRLGGPLRRRSKSKVPSPSLPDIYPEDN